MPRPARPAAARRAALAAGLACAILPGAPAAHPHIFVDAGLVVERDAAGRVVAVEVTWRYDDLYSLLTAEDFGLDPDHDLRLTDEEVGRMLGFDLNWSAGFEGGLVLRQGAAELALGPPEPVALRMTPEGRIETTHRRRVEGADPAAPLEAQVYDPAFYVAFEMILPIAVADAPACTVDLIRADLDAAYAALEAALAEIGGVVAAEDNFPAVGALFADRAVIACPG
jgi:ABC-type uncharacterized transport system substrate-binding protein